MFSIICTLILSPYFFCAAVSPSYDDSIQPLSDFEPGIRMPTVRASAAWAIGASVAENAKAVVSSAPCRIKRRVGMKDLALLVGRGKSSQRSPAASDVPNQ